MSFNDCEAKLMGLTRELSIHWEEVSLAWRDKKRDEFYHTYIAGLFHNTNTARNVITRIDEMICTVRKDCE